MLAAMEDAAAELECAIREDGTGSAEDAFGILSRAISIARGQDTYQDAAGTEWPVGVTTDAEERETLPVRGRLLSVARDNVSEFWTVEHEHATVTITTDDSGRIIDAAEWRDGEAVQLSADDAKPLLEAAVAHNERQDEPSDDPGELKEQQDFAQDDLPEPSDPDAE